MKYQHSGYFNYILRNLLIVRDGLTIKAMSNGYTTWHEVDEYIKQQYQQYPWTSK